MREYLPTAEVYLANLAVVNCRGVIFESQSMAFNFIADRVYETLFRIFKTGCTLHLTIKTAGH
jgi:hypothetical protein